MIYLTELPHIRYGSKPKEIIDLGLELRERPWKFARFILSIFHGKPVRDKYGNVIHLVTSEEKEQFAKKIKENSYYMYWLKNYLPHWLYNEMEDSIRNIILKTREREKRLQGKTDIGD